MKKIRRLAIIPARGKSKRIKNKNIKNFLGTPIIYFTIDSAKKSNLFSKIHVSTESKRIKKIVEKRGVKIDFMRSSKLSDDYTPLIDVFKFVINKYKNKNIFFDEIWALMPCTPLLDHRDLKKISILCKKNKLKKPVLSISKYSPPIQWSYKKSEKLFVPLNIKYHKKRSQNLPDRYFDSGQFIIFSRNFFSNSNFKKNNNKFFGYEMPYHKSIDIDDKRDWELAEIIYKGMKKRNK